MQKLNLLLIALVLGLYACQQAEVKTITLTDLTLGAEGPYFEGPNTFQATLSQVLKNNQINPEQVARIELASAEITLPDSTPAGLIQDFSVQLVSSKSDMKKVAFINPLPANTTKVPLTIAQDQEDLSSLFSSDEAIVLLDANLTKDVESALTFKSNLTFKITLK